MGTRPSPRRQLLATQDNLEFREAEAAGRKSTESFRIRWLRNSSPADVTGYLPNTPNPRLTPSTARTHETDHLQLGLLRLRKPDTELVETVDAIEKSRGCKPPIFVDIRIRRSIKAVGFNGTIMSGFWMKSVGNNFIETRAGPPIQIADPETAKDLLHLAKSHGQERPRLTSVTLDELGIDNLSEETREGMNKKAEDENTDQSPSMLTPPVVILKMNPPGRIDSLVGAR
ncbi:MAG: hypothetical protein K8U57_18070 [Planctomycetes bacterium]|nr:hypothetical protein [Planctomycetota bacterium]